MAKRPINYTSRDFNSIKQDLVNYAKRYYPTTFKDFNEASFGSLMLDMVSYIGDQLSFYTDYQANESFLDTAMEYDNVVRLAKQLGYKTPGAATSTGICTFYILVPAATSISGPDTDYIPILRRGSIVSGDNGSVYTLIEDVDFSLSTNEITVARVDTDTGVPTYFAIRAYGTVVSGEQLSETIEVSDYQRFLRLEVAGDNISEIISVTDDQGHEYYEVPNLSQDIIYQEMPNKDQNKNETPYILKTRPVPRRFVTEYDSDGTVYLQFGYGSEDNITGDPIADPSDVVLNLNGKNYISDTTFDPSNLIKTDKFGVVPTNTTLTVSYRANTSRNSNASAGTVNRVNQSIFEYVDRGSLVAATLSTIEQSLEVENESPILGDTSVENVDEIRSRAYSAFASQDRAVTRTDYISVCYRMPSKFGRIKRVNVTQDPLSLKRNLNLYVLTEDTNQKFAVPSATLKDNLKVWINNFRMINDTVDILDGAIINYGIDFEVVGDLGVDKYEILQNCIQKIKDKVINVQKEIGEPVYITDIYKHLNSVPGVVDTVSVKITSKTGTGYSSFRYDVDTNLSDDGRVLLVPHFAVAEVFNPDLDIQGVVK